MNKLLNKKNVIMLFKLIIVAMLIVFLIVFCDVSYRPNKYHFDIIIYAGIIMFASVVWISSQTKVLDNKIKKLFFAVFVTILFWMMLKILNEELDMFMAQYQI